MTLAIKICGICNLADANIAIEHGAHYLGFIFVKSSPRYVEPAVAQAIAEELNHKVKLVGAFQNAPNEEIAHVADSVGLDYIQLHGTESPAVCATMPKPVIKAFQITTLSQAAEEQPCLTLSFKNGSSNNDQADLNRFLSVLNQYRPNCSHFLFDKPKNIADAKWLDFVTTQLKPIEDQLGEYFLAGGLNARNIQIALQKLQPAVLDIASGVEQNPREKNGKLMTELFTAIETLS
jgi:phosphoribosylanthranilate isomerase